MTIAGHHTAAELRDWLHAVDYSMKQIGAAYNAFAATWRIRDLATHDAWLSDWNALQGRVKVARDAAQAAINHPGLLVSVPETTRPVEDEWQGMVHALAQTPGTTTRGDLQDLSIRLSSAGQHVDMSRMPQPATDLDVDLSVYQAADHAIRTGEAAARDLAKAAGNLAPSKGAALGVLLALGLALGVGGVVAAKVVLR